MAHFPLFLLIDFRRKFSDSDHHPPSRPGRKQQPVHSDSGPGNKRAAKEEYVNTSVRQVEKPSKSRKIGGGDTGDESQASESVIPR